MSVEPDTKDWTWVLDRPCPECGFDAGVVTRADLPGSIVANAEGWRQALLRAGATERPRPEVWSPAEYACHVRDVHLLFEERLRLMLDQDDPSFANWDQDVTAVEQRYDLQEPAVVGPELVDAAARVASTYASVAEGQWGRVGRRSNGSVFTVESLGRYHLHDVVHHLWDVGFDPAEATMGAYDGAAADYAAGRVVMPDPVAEVVARFADRLAPGARVLEIGSGGGRDADALEAAGLSVRRTDAVLAFVTLLRGRGLDADQVDPVRDDLSDPAMPGRPFDAVWANASLLHVERSRLSVVLGRLAAVTRPGGVLRMTVKEGDGDAWSVHGRVEAPRRFTFWREGPLRGVLDAAGWDVDAVTSLPGDRGERWLDVTAVRR